MTTTTTTTTKTPAISCEIIGTVVTFTTADGLKTSLDAMSLTAELRDAAMMHGLKQKLGDAAAISRNPDTGRSATTADKLAAIEEVRERLLSGAWNKGRAAGEGAGPGGLLFKALCRVKADKTPAEVKAYLDGRTKEEQAALRKVPAIASAIQAIKAENAKDDGIDGEALLAGF